MKKKEEKPKVVSIASKEVDDGVRIMVLKSNGVVILGTYQDYSVERDNPKITSGKFPLGTHALACDFKKLPESDRKRLEKNKWS